jgi:serine/threonine-protein kinase
LEASEAQPIAGGDVGDAAKERAAALVGQTLVGRYRIEELVALGGIASVLRATRLSDGKEMAIKVLHPEAEGLPELIERFEREAIAGKHILHPNVVTVHEIERLADGSWFLVQDFVRGRTLRDLIAEGPVAPLRAARIARHVAAGLNAAHDLAIVHRDIKPLNLMLVDGDEENVQIVDFGLAKVPVESLALLDEDGRRSLTQAGVVFGTVAYMAPEAALGMRSIDRRSDLYALGVILYEMLAGKHPFRATEPMALFAQHRTVNPQRISERSPGVVVPRPLEDLVRRLLEKDPDARPQHARELMVALDAVIRTMEAAGARPAGALARASWVRAAVVLVAVMALVAVVAWLAATR